MNYTRLRIKNMIHVYHPNRAVKGFACSFWFSGRYNCVFATLIKQSGWDDVNKNGTFKESLNDPMKKVSIKLSDFEVCAILDCIERNRSFTAFHDGEGSPKSISFVPWMTTPVEDDEGVRPPATQRGFSFSISINNKDDASNKNSFFIGLTLPEARLVREYLIFCLHTIFQKTVSQTISKNEVPEMPEMPEEPVIPEPTNNTVKAPESLVDL